LVPAGVQVCLHEVVSSAQCSSRPPAQDSKVQACHLVTMGLTRALTATTNAMSQEP